MDFLTLSGLAGCKFPRWNVKQVGKAGEGALRSSATQICRYNMSFADLTTIHLLTSRTFFDCSVIPRQPSAARCYPPRLLFPLSLSSSSPWHQPGAFYPSCPPAPPPPLPFSNSASTYSSHGEGKPGKLSGYVRLSARCRGERIRYWPWCVPDKKQAN